MAIDKYHLNLAGEFRIASELLKRGVFATVTFGNIKGADILVIGANQKSITIEAKASNSNRFVTSLFQKYPDPTKPHPDFWVLYAVRRAAELFEERFFILSHQELALAQGLRNSRGKQLSYLEFAALYPKGKGVDNVLIANVEKFENAWEKIVKACNS